MSIESRLRDGLERNAADVPTDTESALGAVIRRRAVERRRLVVVAAAATVAVAALVPGAVSWLRVEPTTPAEPPSVTAADLLGTYVVDVPAPSESAGRWTVHVEAGGRLVLDPPPGQDDREGAAAYAVQDGVLETNALIDSDCQTSSATLIGEYTWVRDGNLVVFTLVRDDCKPRRALFEAPWQVTQ